jgi:hypothetical protein
VLYIYTASVLELFTLFQTVIRTVLHEPKRHGITREEDNVEQCLGQSLRLKQEQINCGACEARLSGSYVCSFAVTMLLSKMAYLGRISC